MRVDLYSAEFFDGAWDLYQELLSDHPVFYDEGLNAWIVSRYDDLRSVFANWSTFSSAHGTIIDHLNTPGFSSADMPGTLFLYDPPEHTRFRRLVSAGFGPKSIGRLDAAIDAAIEKSIEAIGGRREFDLVAELANPFPAEVMFDLIGVPATDRPAVMEQFGIFMAVTDDDPQVSAARRAEAVGALSEYFAGLAAAKRVDLADDIVSGLIESRYVDDEGNEQCLTDEELTGYLLFLTSAGVETTGRLLGGTIVAMRREPSEWQKLLADRSKLAAAIEEGGRFESPVQYIGRRCTRDSVIGDQMISAGSNVLLMIGAANRDPRVYSNPNRFDIDRDFTKAVPLTYSFGPHLCLGIHLARREAQKALAAVLNHWPALEIQEAGLARSKAIHMIGWEHVPVRTSTSVRANV